MLKRGTLSLLISSIVLVANIAQANERSKIYAVPDDVKCSATTKELFSDEEEAPISKKVTYCTDKEGKPLNGQMIKYYQGMALKRYPMKDGYLHGVGKIYYKNGSLKTALNYSNGVLNGYVLEFDNKKNGKFNGNLVEQIPYVNGQKEGIATYYNDSNITKVIYEKDKMHGGARIWDAKTKIKIYDLRFNNDKLNAAVYYYDAKGECEDDCQKEHCKTQCSAEELYKCVQKCQALDGKTKEVRVPPLLIEGIAHQCLSFRERLNSQRAPVTFSPDSECNKMWLAKNENKIFKYLGQQPQKGTLVDDPQKIAEKRLTASDFENIAKKAGVSVEPVAQETAEVKKTSQEKEQEEKADEEVEDTQEAEATSIADCEDLGLPGAYTLKETYQTEEKDTVCVVIKNNTENLLQYDQAKEILRIWAPKKACSKAEKILNPETCDVSTLLYKFRMGKREIKQKRYSYGILAGVYAYINQENRPETRKIPPLIVEGINQKCLVLQEVLSYNACPIVATGSSKDCNQMWRQQHREEILRYIKECRAKK